MHQPSIKFSLLAFMISLTPLSCYANAVNTLQISRYSTVAVTPSDAQINPLETIVEIHFPQKTKTINQAITLLLNNTGFSLAPFKKLSPEMITTLKKPLPIVDRNLGPITIHQALEVLMGTDVFQLDVDALNREINFKLQKQYADSTKKSAKH